MRAFALLGVIALAACSGEERTAGGTTANEARALEDAAEMLHDRRVPADAIPTGQPQVASPQPTAAPKPKPSG